MDGRQRVRLAGVDPRIGLLGKTSDPSEATPAVASLAFGTASGAVPRASSFNEDFPALNPARN